MATPGTHLFTLCSFYSYRVKPLEQKEDRPPLSICRFQTVAPSLARTRCPSSTAACSPFFSSSSRCRSMPPATRTGSIAAAIFHATRPGPSARSPTASIMRDRKSVVEGKGVYDRVDLGGRRHYQKKKQQ